MQITKILNLISRVQISSLVQMSSYRANYMSKLLLPYPPSSTPYQIANKYTMTLFPASCPRSCPDLVLPGMIPNTEYLVLSTLASKYLLGLGIKHL